MKQIAGKQKAAQSAAPMRNQETGAGAQGVALVPPVYGAEMVDSQPVQRMVNGKSENRTGLPDRLKAGVEQLSGLAMDDVQVHYNSTKPAQLQALAYTQGTEIHVGPGQEKHLPHEAWHVVQQKRERVPATLHTKGVPINDDRNLEHEAHVMGTRALHLKYSDSGKSLAVIHPVTTVQRVVIASLPSKRKIPDVPVVPVPLPNSGLLQTDVATANRVPYTTGNSDFVHMDMATVPYTTGNSNFVNMDMGTANRVPYTTGNSDLVNMDMGTANRVPYTTGNSDLVHRANIEQIRRHSLSKSGSATKVRIVGYKV